MAARGGGAAEPSAPVSPECSCPWASAHGSPIGDLETGRALPGVCEQDQANNGFAFDVDPDGLSCPIGAHIRRANPRTGDVPPGAFDFC
jgi:hypothetical protein